MQHLQQAPPIGIRMRKCAIATLTLASMAIAGLSSGEVDWFVEASGRAGIDFLLDNSPTADKNLIETMGGGCAFLDYNRDGKLDLYFTNGAAIDPAAKGGRWLDKSHSRYWNRMYAGLGGGRFEDVTLKSGAKGTGYGMGVAVGDYDNDGYPDFYVTNYGANELFHNRRDGTFEELGKRAGVEASGWSSSAAFFDYDRDGFLDLYVVRYLNWSPDNNIFCGQQLAGFRSYCHPEHYKGVNDILYHNERDGTFRDVSKTAGIALPNGKGLGVAIVDFDGDQWPDVYVANDSVPCFLFRNQKGRGFEEVGLLAGAALKEDGQAFAGMGVDSADLDNDGWPDLFVTALSLQGYALFRNEKNGTFSDSSRAAGISRATFNFGGWGTKLLDFDNDGWKDIFVANSHVMDNIDLTFRTLSYKQPLLLLGNQLGKFAVVSNPGKCFAEPWPARGAAFGDYDNDGDVDIAVTNLGGQALILENRAANRNGWVGFDLAGSRSNRDGVGARLVIEATDGSSQTYSVNPSGSYLSSSDFRVTVGLGATRVKSAQIDWPSGTSQRLGPVAVRQYHRIVESVQ